MFEEDFFFLCDRLEIAQFHLVPGTSSSFSEH